MELTQVYDRWHEQVHGTENPNRIKLEQWHHDALKLAPKVFNRQILEVGCGAGDFAISLAQLGACVKAVDFSFTAISLARKKLRQCPRNVDFKVADAENLPFASDIFDVVFSCECLEHVPNPCAALKEMSRVLKPGSHLVLTTENYSNAMVLAWLATWLRRIPFNSGVKAQPIAHFFL